MSVTCECVIAGWCERRKSKLPESMFRACQSGRGASVDVMLAGISKIKSHSQEQAALRAKQLEPQPRVQKRRTGYGDRLAAIIERETGEQTTCTGCQNEIGNLNWMSREQVLIDIDGLAARIRDRASVKARAWWQRWGCTLAPGIVEGTIKKWIVESVSNHPASSAEKCGIRIVTSFGPKREERQLACLRSWQAIGCDVVAVQTAREAEHVASLYSGVEVVVTDKVGDRFGKPNHVRIASLIDQCSHSPGLLLNSDIEAKMDAAEFSSLWTSASNEFCIGIRWDQNATTGEKKLQKFGIDAFLVTPDMARRIPDLGFAIGTPVWDYWLPYHAAMRLKKRLVVHKHEGMCHEMHEQQWSDSEIKIGMQIMQRNYRLNTPAIHNWILKVTGRSVK